VGEYPQRSAARNGNDENDTLKDCEAHYVSLSPQENRGCSKSEVGEVQGAAKKGGVKSRRENRARCVGGGLSL
jgi:hypothetical protein